MLGHSRVEYHFELLNFLCLPALFLHLELEGFQVYLFVVGAVIALWACHILQLALHLHKKN